MHTQNLMKITIYIIVLQLQLEWVSKYKELQMKKLFYQKTENCFKIPENNHGYMHQ